jgi:hypothetical protein
MATRRFHLLKAKQVATLPPGRHYDGNGLYLVVKPSGVRSWTLIFQFDGKRREKGLGDLGLADARDEASAIKRCARNGVDPFEDEKRTRGPKPKLENSFASPPPVEEKIPLTFGQFSDVRFAELRGTWTSETHAQLACPRGVIQFQC